MHNAAVAQEFSAKSIREALASAKLILESDLARAAAEQERSGRSFEEILLEMGLIDEHKLTRALSTLLSIPWVSLRHVEFTRDVLSLIPAEVAREHMVVPIYLQHARRGRTLFVALGDPSNENALTAVARVVGLPVKPMIATRSDVRAAIRAYYGGPPDDAPQTGSHPKVAKKGGTMRPAARKTERPPAPRKSDRPPPPRKSERPVAAGRKSRHPTAVAQPKMKSLTLLDGTRLSIPVRAELGGHGPEQGMTAKDLVAALLARSQGIDVDDVLPEKDWESLFAALLSLLTKKGLIADWEFVEEWNAGQSTIFKD